MRLLEVLIDFQFVAQSLRRLFQARVDVRHLGCVARVDLGVLAFHFVGARLRVRRRHLGLLGLLAHVGNDLTQSRHVRRQVGQNGQQFLYVLAVKIRLVLVLDFRCVRLIFVELRHRLLIAVLQSADLLDDVLGVLVQLADEGGSVAITLGLRGELLDGVFFGIDRAQFGFLFVDTRVFQQFLNIHTCSFRLLLPDFARVALARDRDFDGVPKDFFDNCNKNFLARKVSEAY